MQKIAQARGMMFAIAKRLGITRFAVCQWKYVPANRLKIVAEMSGLPIEELTRNRAVEWRAKINGAKVSRKRKR